MPNHVYDSRIPAIFFGLCPYWHLLLRLLLQRKKVFALIFFFFLICDRLTEKIPTGFHLVIFFPASSMGMNSNESNNYTSSSIIHELAALPSFRNVKEFSVS